MIEPLPDIECACATVRRAARFVTQLCDEEFDRRLEASQLSTAGRRAQARLRSAMTTKRWDQMWEAVRILTNASQQVLNKGGNAL